MIASLLLTPLVVLVPGCDEFADDGPTATASEREAVPSRQDDAPTPDDSTAHPPSRSQAADLPQRLAACANRCDAKRLSASDEATCRLHCIDTERPKIGECKETCAETMIECWVPCDDARLATNRSTCELRCQNAADHCVERCVS